MTEQSAAQPGGSAATADALVDAAEQRFATEGIDRASLRAVMRDAGSDPGAIHYHFGGREPLAVAVLDRILAPLNSGRMTLLVGLEDSADGEPLPLGALVEALIRPDVETAVALDGRGPGRARLIGAIYLHPAEFVKAEVERHFGPVAQRFMPHLVAALPDVPAGILSWRVRWFVFGVVGALMAEDGPSQMSGQGSWAVDQLVADLVAPVAAALAAPVAPIERSAPASKQ